MNYFNLFNLKQEYDIDISSLKEQYLIKQNLYHPDRETDLNQKKSSIEKSILINEAYKILKDEYLRAEYLLKLEGYKFDEASLKSRLSFNDLEEIMNQLEEVEMNFDQKEILKEMEGKKLAEKAALISKLSVCFSTQQYELALDFTIFLKYLTNLVKNIQLRIKQCK